MKEIIKKKMEEHVHKILAKEEISNEDYCLLCGVYQKIEAEEKAAEMAAQMEADKEKNKEKQKEMFETLCKGLCSFD